MKATGAALIALLAVAVLSGCGQLAGAFTPAIPLPSEEDLVGTWVHDQDDTSSGATLVIGEDGSFSFSGVPVEALDGVPSADREEIASSRSFISAAGTWSVPEQSSSPFPEIELSIDDISELGPGIDADVVYGTRTIHFADQGFEGKELSFWIGDPDEVNWYRFTRADS